MVQLSARDKVREAVQEAWGRHNLGTYGKAERRTSIERTSLVRLKKHGITSRGGMIQWAIALDEDINFWLGIAGFDPIPADLVCKRPDPMTVREQMAEYLVQTNRLTPGEAEEVLSELSDAPAVDTEEWREEESA